MLSIYTSYSCYRCKKEFVLLTEEIENNKGYLACPYCGNRNVKKQRIADSLKECMQERSYKRKNGAIVQK
ncbi:hypothetical protein [Clostridium algidicarnis]|uniref:hypothetical protein n=1 Tax=Clostridium algidicarnis TaxID=37659 RepID=UPI001C0D3BE2|nr:hypothetical protein [Clostridium algidicarnis]MBU3193482.1 hypothetical protein [Clostridium algidicarnis]MBU3203112.1 hypothetical protein [Clostridium algidicarnis]MBU3211266.1 hypothetical protein [Clostridium algidicarnis]MBU3222226.1 hypothetical protein [Clostridium algidicarnis]